MILVTGAMGCIGTAAVAALQQRRVPTRALVPSTRQVPWLAACGAELIEGDGDVPWRIDHALDGVTGVILIARPAADQVETQRRIIDACAARGIRRVVKLSVAGAEERAATEAARWHWRAEQHLRDLAADPCIVRIGRTMQDLLHQEPLILAHHMLVGCQDNGVAADVDARDVGAVLAALAAAPTVPHDPLLVTGPAAISRQELTVMLGHALGLVLRYVPCSPKELSQFLLAAGLTPWQADDLVAYEEAAAGGCWQTVSDAVPTWTGRPARPFEEFAREFAASIRYAHHSPATAAALRLALPPEIVLADD